MAQNNIISALSFLTYYIYIIYYGFNKKIKENIHPYVDTNVCVYT